MITATLTILSLIIAKANERVELYARQEINGRTKDEIESASRVWHYAIYVTMLGICTPFISEWVQNLKFGGIIAYVALIWIIYDAGNNILAHRQPFFFVGESNDLDKLQRWIGGKLKIDSKIVSAILKLGMLGVGIALWILI